MPRWPDTVYGTSKLRYKTHRAVDPKAEVITATTVTPGSTDDGDMLTEMIGTHKENTQKGLNTVGADSKYGTIENYLICRDRKIKAHIPSLEKTHKGWGLLRDIPSTEGIITKGETTMNTRPPLSSVPAVNSGNTVPAPKMAAAWSHMPDKASWHGTLCHKPGGQRGHKHSPAPLRAILWTIDTIWVQESPMAKIMEDADPGLPRLCHTKHHSADHTIKGEDIKEQCPNRPTNNASKSQMGRSFPWIIAEGPL
jgi:hypothetical protein